MGVTIKDVAREAGVSFSTVSKVIHDSHEISEPTAIKVREVMKRMDFTPNVRAASFKRRSTRGIAFLYAMFEKGDAYINPHMYEFLNGVNSVLTRKGHTLTLAGVSYGEEADDTVKAVMSAGGYDGCIVHGSAFSRSVGSMLSLNRFPHIAIGKPDFESEVCWMDTNNVLAGSIAARHLLECGAQHIAFFGGSREDGISNSRLKGVEAALDEIGAAMRQSEIIYTDSTIEDSYSAAQKMFAQKDPPNGIICAGNTFAVGVMRAVQDAGLSLPEDVQLITFDDYPFSQAMNPPLTVVNIDFFDLGEHVASQLLKNIRNPALHVQSYITLPELIVRGTTKSAK